MRSEIDDEGSDFLFKAVLALETLDECRAFFGDLCTYNELLAMTQRFAVASCLNNGATQSEIIEKTGSSSATISRVNRTLLHGNGAYKAVLNKINRNGVF